MSDPTITFYDIASGPPVRPYAPNPWKTRYALNFKRIHNGLQYKTCWVDLPDVAKVRKSLGAAPVRKHDHDGSDFYTLPVIVDRSTGDTVGDSFDIALYLDRQYPPPSTRGEGGGRGGGGGEEKEEEEEEGKRPAALFPASTQSLHRVFNTHVDKIFTDHVPLAANNLPLNPATAGATRAEWSRRAGGVGFDDLDVAGGDRAAMLASFEAALGGLLAPLYARARGEGGPFLEGAAVPMYADFIVGGWLAMMRETLPEWEALRGWHGGVWGDLHDALGRYAQGD